MGTSEGLYHADAPDILVAASAMCPPGDEVIELAARSGLRLLVPANNWRLRRGGSKLYPALTWKGRAFRAALRAWVIPGAARFAHRAGRAPRGGWPLGDLLSPDFPTLRSVAVSIGPPVRGQKVTVQLMDERARVLGFAKYADGPLARERIANEARVLAMLPAKVGPRLVRFSPFMDGDLLVQTPLKGRPVKPRLQLDGAQMRLIGRMAHGGEPYAASGHPFVRSLYAQAGGRRNALDLIVADLEGTEWPLAYMHGDLAPWNMRSWRGEYCAFDWEYGRREGFAYLDAAYTLIQAASLVLHKDPRQARELISNSLAAALPGPQSRFASSVAALAAVYTLVQWYPPDESPSREPNAHEDWLGAFLGGDRSGVCK